MVKRLFSLLFFVFILFFVFSPFKASASNFSTNYDITYNVFSNGLTHVSFKIKLINESNNYYTSTYKINTGFDDLENIKASDSNGSITPKITKDQNGTYLELNFNQDSVGMGKTQNFNFSFDTENVSEKKGNIWEINIPGFSDNNEISNINVHVVVPSTFGKPYYIKPETSHYISNSTQNSYDFTKESLSRAGIIMTFGDNQIYSFNLTYHLKNSNLFPIKTEIAIPPSTNYQDVIIEDINPKPLDVSLDSDGNWLAQYNLLPSERIDVKVKGRVKIFSDPKKEIITDNDLNQYLKSDQYWQSSDTKIKKLASELKTPYEIYKYVVKNLKYDFSRVTDNKPRLGAVSALDNPSSAVCLEFTDLFIAISRAAGIPAREVEGYAYTENSKIRPLSLLNDILHAWPEYYDKELQSWVMIDPTWDNTTGGSDYFHNLDFNHFAFVVKGQKSTYPVPAGGYKLPGQEKLKDVEVKFANSFDLQPSSLEIKLDFPASNFSIFPVKGKLIMKNLGGSVFPSGKVFVDSDFLRTNNKNIDFSNIPPYGTKTVSFSFDKVPILTNKSTEVRIQVGDKVITQSIKITPFFFAREFIILGGTFIATIISIAIIISFKKPKSPQ